MKQLIIASMLLSNIFYNTTEIVQSHDRYCIISNGDGRLLESSNGDERQSVASISKIMTAIIAIEKGTLDDTWHVSKDIEKHAIGSSIYLKPNQKVSLRSLLYGLMLRSGNDAAYEIAKVISGNEKKFVELMNQKARQIGMYHTVFYNASGLDEEKGNLSTACDMAILMRYAMKNPIFRKISGTKTYVTEWNYHWKNKNRLLFDFPFAIAGKTGFTKQAGRTLVTTAKKDGLETTIVTLNMSDDFAFHKVKHQEYLNTYRDDLILKKGIYHFGNKQVHITDDVHITNSIHDPKTQVQLYRKKNMMILEGNGESKLLYRWKITSQSI